VDHVAEDAGATPADPAPHVVLYQQENRTCPIARTQSRQRTPRDRVRRMPRPGPRTRHLNLTHMNRIKRYLEEAPEEPQYGDFYVVVGEFGYFYVTVDVARRIQAALDRWLTPKWIVFPDRVGSLIRVRTRHIRSLVESTAEQRAADRQLDRARKDEERADRRPWDDE
jgi:hypothetical protein